MRRSSRHRLRAVRTLADEQLARHLALKLHLTLAQVLGLIARAGANSAKLRRLAS
jgi:predicted nucleic acid-binding protein